MGRRSGFNDLIRCGLSGLLLLLVFALILIFDLFRFAYVALFFDNGPALWAFVRSRFRFGLRFSLQATHCLISFAVIRQGSICFFG